MWSETRKIMVVDDNIISLMVTDEVLTAHGYEVVKTTSPNGCIAKLDYEQPDILMIDVQMARLAIDDLLKNIEHSEEHSKLVVVLFSAMEPEALQSLCVEKDMHGYFSKTMDVTRLPEFVDHFF